MYSNFSTSARTRCSSVGRAVDCSCIRTSIGHWFDSGRRDTFCPHAAAPKQYGVETRCSSVGRAVDCSCLKTSIGHWFDSCRRDCFAPYRGVSLPFVPYFRTYSIFTGIKICNFQTNIRNVAEMTLLEIYQMQIVAKAIRIAYGNQSFFQDAIDQIFCRLYQSTQQSRYLLKQQPYRIGLARNVLQIDLQSTAGEEGDPPFLSDSEFLQKYQMSRRSFWKLVSLIKHHPVFNTPNRGPKRLPASYQLLVFLKYLGTKGSGNSNPDMRNIFRTGRKTNDLYKVQVLCAIWSLKSQYYTWTDEAERRTISCRIQNKYSLPNCVGFADGTLNPLATQSCRHDVADYFGRKDGYALSTMIICDDKNMFLYHLAGWPGSCHDNRIFQNSSLGGSPHEYFADKEYLLGDSAFEAA